MNNSFILGRRVLAVVTAAVTILATVGIAAFAPMTAHAGGYEPGDNIKGPTLSTVYYYGYDGNRYTYPNEKTWFTWWDGFSGVVEITDSELADITLAGNIVYRPGSRWIKIDTDPKTYAVARDGMIHWIETEAVATDYDGSDWNTNIDDVPDVFFVDYTAGASLMSATAFDGMLYTAGGADYLAWDGDRREVTANGMSANNIEADFILDGAGIDDSSLVDGSDVTGFECDLLDAAQTGCPEDDGGMLTVSLSSDTAASMTVPNSATGVEVATFELSAGDAVTLETLAVTLGGLSDTDVVASNGVYLYEGGARLTDGRTVNSSTRKATFAGLNLDFASGQDRELTVVVDMNASNTDAGTFDFGIASSNDVMTNGTVGGSFPVTGNTHTVVDLDVGSITIDKTGTIQDPTIGEQDATIAEFNLEAGSAEDVNVHSITLEVNEAADHSDYQLYQGTDWIAAGESIGNDLVLFEIDPPYFLADGTDRNFDVTADIGGDAGDNITVHLDSDADLRATGDDFGFGVSVTRTGYDEGGASCASSADDCSFSTIQGGDVTLAFNGPPAGDVQNGSDDVLFYQFSITAERFIEVQEMQLDVTGTDLEDGTNTALEDIRIEDCDTGTLITGPVELSATGGDTQALDFTDSFFLDAGETLNLCAEADVNDAVAADGDEVTFTLDVSEFDIEDSSGDAVTDIVPGTGLAGNTQTVLTASLTTSLSATPAGNTDYVKGQTDVLAAGFNFTAGTASDIELTDVTATVYVDEDGAGTFAKGEEGATSARDRITSCSLVSDADDSVVAGPESPTAGTGGELIFDGFSWWVLAGETGTLNVECNLANVAPGTADIFAFEIDTATDVVANDEDGDGVTPTGTANTSETTTITIVDAGTLDVTAGANVPDAEFLITGSSDNLVSSFRFESNSEAFRIDRLTVTEEQAEDDTGTANSDAYANNISRVTINYETEDGSAGSANGTLTGNERTFNLTSGNEIWVPKDDSAEVDVLVNASTSDRSGGSAQSNEKVRMGLSVDTTADDQFRARGAASNETLDDDSDDSSATAYSTVFPGVSDDMESHVVRETAPTVTLSASTPSGSGFVPGDQEVLRINVAANSNEDVVLRNLIFDISSSDNATSSWNFCFSTTTGDITASDFDFYNRNNLGTALDDDAEWTLLASDGSTCTGDTDVVEFAELAFSSDTEQESILAGTTHTYSLFFDSSGASSASDDSVQFLVASDPIVGTFLDGGADIAAGTATQDPDDTTITVSGAGSFEHGDVLCNGGGDTTCDTGEEQMLLVGGAGTTTLTVVRGYNGTDVQADASGPDNLLRLPGALLWQDDGSKSVSDAAEEYYGAHLVNDLPMTGSNAMSF